MATDASPVARTFDGATEEAKLAHDHKREVDHRRKYNLGTLDTGVKLIPNTPLKQRTQRRFRLDSERGHRAVAARSKLAGKHPTALDSETSTSDSSAEEDVKEASAAPEPDADIAYSFDAQRGPSHGSEILSMAINKAVERYENKATEKLVKDEYEVVAGHEVETRNAGYIADEDDYELV